MSPRIVKILLAGSLALLIVAVWRKDVLPEHETLRYEMLREPEQTSVQQAPFESSVNGVTYNIQPLYTYDLYGLVVSTHDSNAWWDYIHRDWNDHLNVVDLCVVWGENARRGAYEQMDFSNGQFVCYFNTRSREVYNAFDQTAFSNNHLLTDNAEIASELRQVRAGDQVHFRGYLAEYSHNYGRAFKRGTSISRADTGNGACETVYVEAFEVLRRGGGAWPALAWMAGLLLATSVVAWFSLPVRFDH